MQTVGACWSAAADPSLTPPRPPPAACSDWGGLPDSEPAAATLTTTTGEKISADLVFKCVGVRPATGLYAASLQGPGQLSSSGAVAVEPTLQARGKAGRDLHRRMFGHGIAACWGSACNGDCVSRSPRHVSVGAGAAS